ncbi:MAG: serine protease Do [Pyrinomonadaceae bacterium]|jgi:serine protease Do|nr:serine protease Do [Pyrinomonadaceae bacterium]
MITVKLARSLLSLLLGLVLCVGAFAQTPPPRSMPARTPEAPGAKPETPVQVENSISAPRVVTILHRLNGLKVIRLLLRGNEQLGAIANIDDAFQMSSEVHTNVIAGLALSDGQTIAAWLPEAEAELPPPLPFAPAAPPAPVAPGSPITRSVAPPPMAFPALPPTKFHQIFPAVDLKVVMRDGRNLPGQYVGLDGLTGLSVITVSNSNLPKTVDARDDSIQAGQRVRLIGPEPVSQTESGAKGIYVRVGEIEATVVDVTRTALKTVARVRIKSPKITPANIGAIAVNSAGEPLGIVNAVEGDEASILPVGLVRSAAGRVMARRASVPRPWLGVRGEPIGRLSLERILKVGWQGDRARALAEKRQGLLLTSVMPGSPAARAELKPGDVILRVNNEMVLNADDFSMFLQDAAPGSFVNFTVMRPGTAASEAFKIKLAESPNWFFGPNLFDIKTPLLPDRLFVMPGVETIAIKPRVAARLGATGGLLVVYAQPNSVAYTAGLRAGDVIESVNGESIVTRAANGVINKSSIQTVVVVRNKKKLTIAIPAGK